MNIHKYSVILLSQIMMGSVLEILKSKELNPFKAYIILDNWNTCTHIYL